MRDLRHAARRILGDGLGDGADVLGRGAATAADDVDQAVLRPFLEQPRHVLWRLVIFAHLVRKARIGIDADQRIGDRADLGHEGRSCSAPKEQFEPTEKGRRCFSEYQKASGVWPDRLRPERSVMVSDSMIGSSTPISSNTCSTAKPAALAFSVSKIVSIRIDVHAALDQSARLRGIGLNKHIEAHIAEAGIVHVGGDRRGAVGGADGAGDEAGFVRRPRRPGVGRLAGEPGGSDIQLMCDGFKPIIGLGDGLRVEGVGLDDVGAGLQIGVVDLADDVRLGQHKQIVVALQIVAMVLEARAPIARLVQLIALDHGAHGAVEDQDALLASRFSAAMRSSRVMTRP